jgi:hypothetical protein
MVKIESKNFSSKKSMFALEQLIGILLSSMVIIMLFMYFIVPFFFNTPTNLKVAKSNANSIKDFIDMSSSGEFKNLEDCFNVLKINNLENFQFTQDDKDNDNYFYVIGKERVYVVPFKYISDIKDVKNINAISKYKTDEFEGGEVNIVYDETDQCSFISAEVDITFFVSVQLGQSDTKLQISNKGDYLILYPIIGDGSFIKDKVKKFAFKDYSQNTLGAMMYSRIDKDYEDIGGDNLVFKGSKRDIFVSNGDASDLIIDNFLCSYMYLDQQDRISYYKKNIEDVPLTSMKVVVDFLFKDSSKSDYIFEYVGNEVKCYYKESVSCKDNLQSEEIKNIYDDIMSSKNVDEFKSKIDIFYNHNEITGVKEGTMRFNPVELTDEEKQEISVNIGFDDVFEKLEGHNNGFTKKDRNTFVFSLNNYIGINNIEFNGVETDYSNEVVYKNGKAYFYVKGDKNSPEYYSFREDWLEKEIGAQKENIDIFFRGERVNYEKRKLKVSDAGIFKFDDESGFYILKLDDIGGKSYDVVLSPVQVSKMG